MGEAETGDGSAPPRAPWAWVAAIGLSVSVAAVLIYREVGAPYALNIVGPGPSTDASGEGAAPELDAAIAGLEAKLRSAPDDPQGWVLLGRSYMAVGKHQEALRAYGEARRLEPEEPVVMVDYAEALAFASGTGRLPDESRALLERAVAVQPDNQKGLWLLGMGAFQAEEYVQAGSYWERLIPLLEPGSGVAEQVGGLLAEARSRSGTAPVAPDTSPTPKTPSATVAITVDVAPEMAARIQPGDTLFVLARLPEGPRMPLAVKRVPASGFPVQLTLSDADAMSPAMTLSSADAVVITARVSKSGNAAPQPPRRY